MSWYYGNTSLEWSEMIHLFSFILKQNFACFKSLRICNLDVKSHFQSQTENGLLEFENNSHSKAFISVYIAIEPLQAK